MRLFQNITKLLLPVFALAALLVLVVADLPAVYADVSVTRAELDRGRLRIEGNGAAPNATISVTDVANPDVELAQGTADDRGRFRIKKQVNSPSCPGRVMVSDGNTTQTVPLDPCNSPDGEAAEAEPPPPAFAALEVALLEEPLEVPATLHQSPVATPNNSPVPAGLPAGTITEFVIEGVVSAINGTRTEWQVGNPPLFVYPSATTRFDKNPQVGDLVKIIAVRTVGPGPVVAERIRQRAQGPLPVGPAVMEVGFLFSGLLTSEDNDVLTIGGIRFAIVELPEPTEMDPGVAEGSVVVVGFVEAAGLAPAP